MSKQSFIPWFPGEPNGLTVESCGSLHITGNKGIWLDRHCENKYCVACQISSAPVFVLRGKVHNFKAFAILDELHFFLGLCDGSSFDAHFGMTSEYSKNTEIYFFRGFQNSLLEYRYKTSMWIMTLYTNPSIYATFNGTATYPFGVQKWNIFNDTCKQKTNEESILNFNACHPKDEYNCADGTW